MGQGKKVFFYLPRLSARGYRRGVPHTAYRSHPQEDDCFQNLILFTGCRSVKREKNRFFFPTLRNILPHRLRSPFFYAKRHLSTVRISKRVPKVSALCEDESAFSRICLPCAHVFRPFFQDSMRRQYDHQSSRGIRLSVERGLVRVRRDFSTVTSRMTRSN